MNLKQLSAVVLTTLCCSLPSISGDTYTAPISATRSDDPLDVIHVPTLRPVSTEQATKLARLARKLRVSDPDYGKWPVAWSSIKQACGQRAEALQYALVTADFQRDLAPPTMERKTLTSSRIQEIMDNRSVDIATIHVVGPLNAYQTLIDPKGKPLSDQEVLINWSSHIGAVMNVEGELKVIDLSIGDQPLPIAQWVASFVEPGVECTHMTENEFSAAFGYQIGWSLPGSDKPIRPPRICGYVITPMFSGPWWSAPTSFESIVYSLQGDPVALAMEARGFYSSLLKESKLFYYKPALAMVTSTYRAAALSDFCLDQSSMKQCELADADNISGWSFDQSPSAEGFKVAMTNEQDGIIMPMNWPMYAWSVKFSDPNAFDILISDSPVLKKFIANRIYDISMQIGKTEDVSKQVKTDFINSRMSPYSESLAVANMARIFYNVDQDNWFSMEKLTEKVSAYLSSYDTTQRYLLMAEKFDSNNLILRQGISLKDTPIAIDKKEKTITIFASCLYD